MASNLGRHEIATECKTMAEKLEFIVRFFVGDVVTPLVEKHQGGEIAVDASKLFERVQAAHELAVRMERRASDAACGRGDVASIAADCAKMAVELEAMKCTLELCVIAPLADDADAYDVTFEATGFAWSLDVASMAAARIRRGLH